MMSRSVARPGRGEKMGFQAPRGDAGDDELKDKPGGGGCGNHEARLAMIAETAYFLAAHRDFAPGRALDDWLAAECEVDAALAKAAGSGQSRER